MTPQKTLIHKLNSNKVIAIGFSLILILLGGLISIWLWHIDRSKQLLNDVIEEHQESTYISLMRDAVQERVLILHSLYVDDDPFRLEELFYRFNQHAAQFILARDQLLKLNLNGRERIIWNHAKDSINNGQDIQQKVFNLIREDKREQARKVLIEEVIPNQEEVIQLLTQLLNVPLTSAHVTAQQSYHDTALAFSLVSLFGIGVYIAGIAIALYVGRATRSIEKKLIDATSAAQEANLQKSLFLANMSHEIRTPLTSITGFAQAVRQGSLSIEEHDAALDKIIRNSKHLLHIINDILDISKIESQKMLIEKIDVNIAEFIEELTSVIRIQAQHKDITFETQLNYPIPKLIKSDPVRLKQILLNLLSNAIKFTQKGTVQFRVSHQNNTLTFEVLDTGIGMSAEELENMFRPFHQADASTTRKYGGTGLGLSIAKQLSELLGGTISVQSTIGKGTSFKLFLSTDPNTTSLIYSAEHLPIKSAENISEIDVEGHVLMAEDNRDIQDLAKVMFKNSRIKLTVVNNGQEAVETALTEGADLILMDMQMPIMDGIEATSLLRAAGFTKPIIALTANIMREDIEKYRKIGITDWVGKPIDQAQINRVLNDFLPQFKKIDDITQLPEYQSLKKQFLESLDRLLAEYRDAYSERNLEGVRVAAHTIKGVAGTFEQKDLSAIAAEIEVSARNNNWPQVELASQKLDDWHKPNKR